MLKSPGPQGEGSPRPVAGRPVIDHSNPQEAVQVWFPGDDLFTPAERRRGLPLGNQTSQFFANVYLDPLDHFVPDRLGLSYVRYVDDFLVFDDDKRRLAAWRENIGSFLEGLRLRLHPDKSVIFPARQGIRFLGYRVQGSHLGLARENVWRFRRRLRYLHRRYAGQQISLAEVRMPVGGLDRPRPSGRYGKTAAAVVR